MCHDPPLPPLQGAGGAGEVGAVPERVHGAATYKLLRKRRKINGLYQDFSLPGIGGVVQSDQGPSGAREAAHRQEAQSEGLRHRPHRAGAGGSRAAGGCAAGGGGPC